MPHEALPKSATVNSRLITKPRVIVGLLGEIDASETLVMFVSRSGGGQFTSKVASEFKMPFETSTLMIRDREVEPGSYAASAFFAGQRVTFEVEVVAKSGACALPKDIKISDLRQSKRRRFGPEIEYAEVSTEHGVLMATPTDMSQNSIALVMNSRDGALDKGERVRLVIRGDTAGRDIFSAEMIVQDFKITAGQGRILLGPTNTRQYDAANSRLREVKRQELQGMTLTLSPMDDHLGEPVRLALVDVSLTGFQGRIGAPESQPWLATGMSVHVHNGGLTATVAWHEGGRVGLRLDSLDDPRSLREWSKILSSFKIGSGFHHSHAEELVNLFTESGLLKGKRRHLYGESPGGYLPPDRMTENPLLYRRIQSISEQHKIIGQMSIGRLTDDLWYFQEGAHIGGDGPSFRDLYSYVIALTKDLHATSSSSPRYLSGLYHENIKSAGTFGVELYADRSSRVYPLYQASIDINIKKYSEQKLAKIVVQQIFDRSADDKRAILGNFDATLVEAFSGWNGEHPRLNAELAKLGAYHQAKTVFLSSEASGVWGMAYRLRSYYALNATGVMNSLFMVVKPSISALELVSGLKDLTDYGLAFGTDDVAIIADARPDEPLNFVAELQNPKPFTFFIIDNHLNREFLGGPVETPESISLRSSKKTSSGGR